MSRDNYLFAVLGVLAGFIAGYLLHETMAARQPVPQFNAPGQSIGQVPVSQPAASATASPTVAAPNGADAPAAPAMAEVQRLRTYVEQNPDDAQATRRLADLNYDIRNWPRAVELYERYLAQRPDEPDVLTDLGASYRSLGRLDDALGQFQRASELEPEHWQSRYNAVLVLAFDLGRFDEASTVADELRRLQPGNASVERLIEELERRRAAAS